MKSFSAARQFNYLCVYIKLLVKSANLHSRLTGKLFVFDDFLNIWQINNGFDYQLIFWLFYCGTTVLSNSSRKNYYCALLKGLRLRLEGLESCKLVWLCCLAITALHISHLEHDYTVRNRQHRKMQPLLTKRNPKFSLRLIWNFNNHTKLNQVSIVPSYSVHKTNLHLLFPIIVVLFRAMLEGNLLVNKDIGLCFLQCGHVPNKMRHYQCAEQKHLSCPRPVVVYIWGPLLRPPYVHDICK